MKGLIEGAGKLGIELNARQLEQFELYYQELIEWNKRFNLTAIKDYSGVQVKHFLDSLTITLALTEEEVERPDFSIMDIGTGAGFPGVPLKIIFPQLRLVLIESTAKKTAFLHHIILPTLVELTLPFCQLGGRFVAQKKGEIDQEINQAKKAIATLGGKLNQIKKIELDEFNDERYLIIIDKIYPTPGKYPRRPGTPRRRPIQEVNRDVA